MMRAVQTKKPEMAWAAVVMRKVGWSGLSRGASGNQEMFGPVGATVTPTGGKGGTSRLTSHDI